MPFRRSASTNCCVSKESKPRAGVEYLSGAPVFRLRGKPGPAGVARSRSRSHRRAARRRVGLHPGAAGRRPSVRSRRRPRPEHRRDRRQAAVSSAQGHRHLRRRDDPWRRSGRAHPRRPRILHVVRTSCARATRPWTATSGLADAPARRGARTIARRRGRRSAARRPAVDGDPARRDCRSTASSTSVSARSCSTAASCCRSAGCRRCWANRSLPMQRQLKVIVYTQGRRSVGLGRRCRCRHRDRGAAFARRC